MNTHITGLNAADKIEACVQNRCETLSERSEKLREATISGKSGRLLWTIAEASEDFATEECYRKCERPLAIFENWVLNTTEMQLSRYLTCLQETPNYDHPTHETYEAVK